MFRRDFIQRITVAGASGLATVTTTRAAGNQTIAYKIKGFSCVTCAVGLEVMLRQQKGIARAKASYPDANVVITFDPEITNESSIKDFIASMGFTVTGEPKC